MFVSRIPVPVRNIDDVIRHRSMSANTRLEQLREEFQRKLLVEKHEKLYDFYGQKQNHYMNMVAKRHRFGSGEIIYGHHGNPEETTYFFQQNESVLTTCNNDDILPMIPKRLQGNSLCKPLLSACQKKGMHFDKCHPLAPINPTQLNNKSKNGDGKLDRSLIFRTCDILGDTHMMKKSKAENIKQEFIPQPPEIIKKPQIMRPFVRNASYHIHDNNKDMTSDKSFCMTDKEQHDLEWLKQEKLKKVNEAKSKKINYSTQKVDHALPPCIDVRLKILQKVNENIQNGENLTFCGNKSIESIKDSIQHKKCYESKLRAGEIHDCSYYETVKHRQKQQILEHHNHFKETSERRSQIDEYVNNESDRDEGDDILRSKEKQLQSLIQKQEEQLKQFQQENLKEEKEYNQKQLESERKGVQFYQKKQQCLQIDSLDHVNMMKKQQMLKTGALELHSNKTLRVSQSSLPHKQMWHPEVDPNNEETAFYLQKAISEGSSGLDNIRLITCGVCGRSFASERLAKHEKICSKIRSKKTRKVFDHVAMRYKGTDFENHITRQISALEERENRKKLL